MLKYLVAIVILCGLTLFVARQDERTAQESAHKAAQFGDGAVPAKPNEQHPQENVKDTERHTPGWYSFFRWPSGTTTWAIILTLLVISEQTRQTAKSAKAASDSITFLKQKERARFFVVPFALYGLHDTPTGFYGDEYGRAVVQLTHVGPTDAVNVVGKVKAVVLALDAPLPEMLEMVDVELPSVIKSGREPVKLSTTIRLGDREAVDALKSGATNLHFFGRITYEDVFGEAHVTPFRYVWRPRFHRVTEGNGVAEGSDSQWETCGPPEDNQAT